MIAGLRSRWRYLRLMWRLLNHRGEWKMVGHPLDETTDLNLENLAEAMNRIESRRERVRP